MQQIYTQSHEEFEVFTTVLSPQVCRKRVIFKHQGEMMVVAADYSADCEEELSVRAGEVVLLLYQENADWCYARLQNGKEGYLPTACFTTKQESLRPIVTQASQSFIQTSSNDRIGCSGGRSLKLCQECQVPLDCFSGCSLVDVVTDMLYVRSAPSILHFTLTDACNPRAPRFSSKWVTEQQKIGQV